MAGAIRVSVRLKPDVLGRVERILEAERARLPGADLLVSDIVLTLVLRGLDATEAGR